MWQDFILFSKLNFQASCAALMRLHLYYGYLVARAADLQVGGFISPFSSGHRFSDVAY